MGSTLESIDDDLAAWLLRQKMFFVGTAPRGGHLNLSPKGLDGSFAVLDPHTVAYLDMTGSGVETIAHLRENGRVVLMFCAFEGPPKIVRIYGEGEVIPAGHPDFEGLRPHFGFALGDDPGSWYVRSFIRVRATRIADACGYAVPLYEHKGSRKNLFAWTKKKGPGGLREYRAEKNRSSIDGLPGVDEE